MDLGAACDRLKGRMAEELAKAGPAEQGEILIRALYAFSTEIVPALGIPNRSEEYRRRQKAALDLISFLALPLVQCRDRRGVAVLVEVGEGCADPLLKKKLEVYAQELLAKQKPEVCAPRKMGKRALSVVAATTAVLLVVAVLVKGPRPHSAPAADVDAVSVVPPAYQPAQIPSPLRVPEGRAEPREESAEDEEPRRPAPTGRSTKVRVVNDQVLVPVTLKHAGESVTVELILDTGATRTALFESVATRLRLDLRGSRTARAELADGRVISASLARIDLLSVGPYAHAGFELEFFPYGGNEGPHDGLLGMDFLRRHRYQIDMENCLIQWL